MRSGRFLFLVLLIAGTAAEPRAQVPGRATVETGVGELSTAAGAPTEIRFVWNAAANATWYHLWVDDSTGLNLRKEWFTDARANCDAGQAVCAGSTTIPYTESGFVRWWVQPWSPPNNYGQWSAGQVVEIAGVLRTSATTGNTFAGPFAGPNVGLGIRNTNVSWGGSGGTGDENTSIGSGSDTGQRNTSFGMQALRDMNDGSLNTALGSSALAQTTFSGSTGIGVNGGANNKGGWNVAVGSNTLNLANTQTILNVQIGDSAGSLNGGYSNIYVKNNGTTNEGYTIRIGTNQNPTYLAGVSGVSSPDGLQVYVNGSGQLGTTTSSSRFKKRIRTVGKDGGFLYRLRPVAFTYQADDDHQKQYGLLAEDVARMKPEWVLRDAAGEPQSVRYELLVPLVLEELQNARETLQKRAAQLEKLRLLIEKARGGPGQ